MDVIFISQFNGGCPSETWSNSLTQIYHPANRAHPTEAENPKYGQPFQNATTELYNYIKTKNEIEAESQNIKQTYLADYAQKAQEIKISS